MKRDNYLSSRIFFFLLFAFCIACDDDETPQVAPEPLTLLAISLDGRPTSYHYKDVTTKPTITIVFSDAIDQESAKQGIVLLEPTGTPVPLLFNFQNDSTVNVSPQNNLEYLRGYKLSLETSLQSTSKQYMDSDIIIKLVTTYDPADKFQRIPQTQLLDSVQFKTFQYFWDFAHPTSGMARERNSSGDLVTSGGSGFGIMALIVGIERNFISREEGLARLLTILTFLENTDRYHGAWSHWINGNTGQVIPFSTNDNGGDLVETSFLIQGLLTFRQYLNEADQQEKALIDQINDLWQTVEWDWYTRGESVLYWHWSPDKEWTMNHQIRGYNEALITYVLAAASPTHAIDAQVYHNGWANNGNIENGKTFYDITLPVGFDYGGPLFFSHYSFLGLDPRNLRDSYANYWTQNLSHTLINYSYTVDNPKNYAGYSEDSWGLTASDNHNGYSAHSPTNDLGVISPTAALSSMPYTPEESLRAMEFFYYKLGDRLWGRYGFYDAFNLNEPWFANSYLAIDQGPIVVMIENYRTGLLWDLFMSAPEVQAGLTKLGFTY